MNRQTTLQRSAVLLVATLALCGKAVLADDFAVTKPEPENTNIVVARAATPATRADADEPAQEAVDPAVADALDSLLADNKLELDMRLADHKSVILAADR